VIILYGVPRNSQDVLDNSKEIVGIQQLLELVKYRLLGQLIRSLYIYIYIYNLHDSSIGRFKIFLFI